MGGYDSPYKFVLPAKSLDELDAFGTLTAATARFLEAGVASGLNVIVAGGTQRGKGAQLPPRDCWASSRGALTPVGQAEIVGSRGESRGCVRQELPSHLRPMVDLSYQPRRVVTVPVPSWQQMRDLPTRLVLRWQARRSEAWSTAAGCHTARHAPSGTS